MVDYTKLEVSNLFTDKRKNYLILKEELAELIVATSKLERFGLFNYNPATPDKTNLESWLDEVADVLLFIEINRVEFGASHEDFYRTIQDRMKAKIEKLKNFY